MTRGKVNGSIDIDMSALAIRLVQMGQLWFFILTAILSACSSLEKTDRVPANLVSNDKVTWNIYTETYATVINGLGWKEKANLGFYSPFYIDSETQNLYFFGSGKADHPGNGVYLHRGNFDGVEPAGWRVIHEGPNSKTHNYFRAVAMGRAYRTDGLSDEVWLAAEVTHSYARAKNIRLGMYRSVNKGHSWEFQGLVKANGKMYAGWDGHSGLVYQPDKPREIDVNNVAENRFILIAKRDWFLVSNDGLNFKKAPVSWPFSEDILVFASMIRTPYGYHIMSGDSWVPGRGTTRVRHLFTRDFKTWTVLEENTSFRPPDNYKGIQLTYEPYANKIWAFSDCTMRGGYRCKTGKLGWIEARDYGI